MAWNSRRDFLRAGTMVTSAMAMSAASYSRVPGANERIHLGLIGAGDRGTWDMILFQNRPDVQVVAVCDIYGAKIRAAQQKAAGAKGFTDHRELLAFQPLDAVLIATPDHWHSAIAIDALKAVKTCMSRSR